MIEKRNVPSLSTSNTITNPYLKAEKLLEYFVASVKDQSNFFMDNITSLKFLVFQYSDNPTRFKEEMVNALKKYYLRHYDTVDINISLNDTENDLTVIKVSTVQIQIIAVDANNEKINYTKTIDLEKYLLK